MLIPVPLPLQKQFSVRVKKMVVREKEKNIKVNAGWYSQDAMNEILGYTPRLGFHKP